MKLVTNNPFPLSYVSGLLSTAEEVLLRQDDHDLMAKVTVLKAYFEWSQISPAKNYAPILGRAVRELNAALRIPSRDQAGWIQ
jgi:hypothetical protein